MSMATLDVDDALSVDEILTLTDRLGVDTLPDTLALWPTQRRWTSCNVSGIGASGSCRIESSSSTARSIPTSPMS